MGNGLNFFTNAIDKTPAIKSSWQDVDVSGNGVPSGASGVILELRCTSATNWNDAKLRKNGATIDNSFWRMTLDRCGGYAFVGLDANRIFEALVVDLVEIWLIGYTGSDVVYFDNPSDVAPSTTGSWQDVDMSASIPSGATGVATLQINPPSTNFLKGGTRKNGSTDEFPYGPIGYGYSGQLWQYCGLDANRVFEAKVANDATLLWVFCYFKGVVTFKDNGDQNDPTTAGSWQDHDVTVQTSATADGVLLLAKASTNYTNVLVSTRANGSTDDRTTGHKLHGDAVGAEGACAGFAIGLDGGQVFEIYVDATDMNLYVIAYNEPGAPPAGQPHFGQIHHLMQGMGLL